MIKLNKFFYKQYAVSEDTYAPVYYGNTLKPTHAKDQPEVTFDAKKKLTSQDVCLNSIKRFFYFFQALPFFGLFKYFL